MAECEKMKGYNQLFDLEDALEDAYKPMVGITDKRTKIETENVVERMVPLVEKFVKKIRDKNKTCPIIVGIDSWVRIKPASVQDAMNKGIQREFGQTDAMRNNAVIFDQLSPLFNFLSDNDVILVILNPLKTNYLLMFGDKTTSRGNAVLQYECHMRLTGKLRGMIKTSMPSLAGTKELVVGSKTEWTTTKNRGVKPVQSVTTTLRYAKGIALYSGLEELLMNDETINAMLKEPAKVAKEKDTSNMTDKQLKKHLAAEQMKKAKKANPADFKFKMASDKSEDPTWFDNIKDLVVAHPEALHPLITGEYTTNEDEEFEETIGEADEE